MSDNKKAILVTGGAGFIGSHLTEKLLQKGEEIFVLDNLSTGSEENIKHLEDNPRFHFIKGSVLDRDLVAQTVAKVDQIYHLAAAVGVKTIIDKPLESFLVNVDGTKNVLEAADIRKTPVLITSSSEVYGKNDKLPFKEEDDRIYGSAYHDRWGYGLSKGSDEFLGLAFFREKSLPVVIVRLFNVIGPRQKGAYGMLVPRFIKQALNNEPIEVYGYGGPKTRAKLNELLRAAEVPPEIVTITPPPTVASISVAAEPTEVQKTQIELLSNLATELRRQLSQII